MTQDPAVHSPSFLPRDRVMSGKSARVTLPVSGYPTPSPPNSPNPQNSPMTIPPSPPRARAAHPFLLKLALLLGLGALASAFSSCSSLTSTHSVPTSNGISVSSIHSGAPAPVAPRSAESIPMQHNTARLFDHPGPNHFGSMLRAASQPEVPSTQGDHRTYLPLKKVVR